MGGTCSVLCTCCIQLVRYGESGSRPRHDQRYGSCNQGVARDPATQRGRLTALDLAIGRRRICSAVRRPLGLELLHLDYLP